MAASSYPTGHPLAAKLWAKKLFVESLKEAYFGRFVGKSSNSLIQWKDETQKDAGDRITVGLRMQLVGAGIQGDNTLEGQEEALTTYSDNVFIDQLRHATRSQGKMSEQRVLFDVREENRAALTDWWADRLDTAFFNQLAGNTAVTDTKYTGNQATIAPSTNNIIRVGTSATTGDESLSTVDTFTITTIDRAVARAKTMATGSQPTIRPIKVNGADKYVAFLHPFQVFSLRTTATANTVTWFEINRSAMQGGMIKDNPIYNGAIGEYNNVVLHEATRVPLGVSAAGAAVANTRRAIFCGAQAGLFATGRDTTSPEKMTWVEEEFDYGNQLGVAAGMIFGLKKTVFNSQDFATIVMSSYAAQP